MRRLIRPLLLSLGVGALVVGVSGLIWWNVFLCRGDVCPSVAQFDEYEPAQPARLYAVDGRFIAEVGLERRSLESHLGDEAEIGRAHV